MGDAICTALCNNWYMGSDGRAMYHRDLIDEKEYADNHEAEISCPAGIIRITGI